MRYWLLVILMNVLFWLIVKHVAPEGTVANSRW